MENELLCGKLSKRRLEGGSGGGRPNDWRSDGGSHHDLANHLAEPFASMSASGPSGSGSGFFFMVPMEECAWGKGGGCGDPKCC